MKYFYIILFVICSWFIKGVQVCTSSNPMDIASDHFFTFDGASNEGICINEKDASIKYIATSTGIFTDIEVINSAVCSTANNKVCLKMAKHYNYIMVQKRDKSQQSLLINKPLYDEMIKNDNEPVYFVYPNELQCFKGTQAEEAKFKAIKNAIPSEIYYIPNSRVSYCVIFKHTTRAKHTIVLSNAEIQINAILRNDHSGLLKCTGEFGQKQEITKVSVSTLTLNQKTFCVDTSKYTLDKISRSSSLNSVEGIGDYCKLEENGKYCLKLGSDFEFATFHNNQDTSRLIVMSHETANASHYFGDLTDKPTIVDIFGIGCLNSDHLSNIKNFLLFGYFESADKKMCYVPRENSIELEFYFGTGNRFRYQFAKCAINPTTEINRRTVIKIASGAMTVCVPKRMSIIVSASITGVTINKFIAIDNHVCSVVIMTKICYYLSTNVKYLILANDATGSKILIHRQEAINSRNFLNFVYSNIYYKDEILCVPISKLSEANKVTTKIYAIADSQKVCFVVDLMKESYRISVEKYKGCENIHNIRLDPISTKPSELNRVTKTGYQTLFTFRNLDEEITINSMDAGTNITDCFDSTCFTMQYSIEISASTPNSIIHEIKDCTGGVSECTNGNDDKFMIYKIIDSQSSKHNFIKTKADPTLQYDADTFIYRSEYYKNDVVCFLSDKLEAGQSEAPFHFKPTNFKCSIVRELKAHTSVEVSVQQDCKRVIQLLHDSDNPYQSDNDPAKQCQTIFNNENSVFHRVTLNLMWKCISFRCSKMTRFADASDITRSAYTLRECNEQGGINSCKSFNGKDGLVKLSSPKSDQFKYLHTFHLEYQIPESQYYQKYYDANDLVCFPKSKVEGSEKSKITAALFEGTHAICVLPVLLTNSVQFALKYSDSCSRQITLEKSIKTEEKNSINQIPPGCQRFLSTDQKEPLIVYENVEAVKECFTNMCLQLKTAVTASDEVKDCTVTACDINFQTVKYYKIFSPINEKSFYLINQDALRDTLVSMGINTFYKAEYYISDIVCFDNGKFIDANIQDVNGIVTMSSSKTCYVVNDLTQSRSIDTELVGGCKKKVTFTKLSKPGTESELNKKDTQCQQFIGTIDDSSFPLRVPMDVLNFCISHMCLKTIFQVKQPESNGDYKSQVVFCDIDPAACKTPIQNYDYIKLHNLFSEKFVYVQNSNQRAITHAGTTFHPSPYYKDEAICFPEGNLMEASSYNYINSFMLGSFKCLIIGQIQSGSKIKTKNLANCERSLDISHVTTPIVAPIREIDHEKCAEFLKPNHNREVHSLTLEMLKKCLTHTCSNILSKFDVPEINKPYQTSKISQCSDSTPKYECLQSDKVYDFIKVQNAYMGAPKYFRTFDNENIGNYIQTRSVFYSQNYYNDDLVCFHSSMIVPISETRKQDVAIFSEGERICIILSDLLSDLPINYKATSQCPMAITLSHQAKNPNQAQEGNTRTDCPEFFTKRSHSHGFTTYTKEKLSECVTKTCSKFIQVIQLGTNGEKYHEKSITPCSTSQTGIQCLSNIDNFEGLKVKSPFIHGHIFLQSSATKSKNANFFRTKYYKEQYYAGEVICVDDNYLVTSTLGSESDAVFRSDDATCFMPSELTENVTIQIRLYGKCQKNIRLLNVKAPTADPPATDECSVMYNTPTEAFQPMNIQTLRRCIVSTCVRLEYFIMDIPNGEAPLKRYHRCEKNYGDDSCLTSESSYFIAAVKNPSSEPLIYIKNDQLREFTDAQFDTFFYKSIYYNDEVICAIKAKITSEISELSLLKFQEEKFACIVVGIQRSEDKMTIQTKNGCSKEVILNKNSAGLLQESANDLECRPFYSDISLDSTISTMSLTSIKTCISHTCSKVETKLEQQSQLTFVHNLLAKCTQNHGNSDCLTNTIKYDLIKLTNAYTTKPVYVRTPVEPSEKRLEPKIEFLKSIYSNSEIICFPTLLTMNVKELKQESGVQSTDSQTCIIGSEIRKQIKLSLKVTDNCYRTIIFDILSNVNNHPNTATDQACSKYYTRPSNGENLLVTTKSEFHRCTAYTCSTFRKVDSYASPQSCDATQSNNCITEEYYLSVLLDSPYFENSILLMSEKIKNLWNDRIENAVKYNVIYSPDDIVCLKKDLFTPNNDKIVKYTDATKSIECFLFDENDSEEIFRLSSAPKPKLEYLGKKGTTTPDASVKKLKIEVYGRLKAGNNTGDSIDIVYSYQGNFDASKKDVDFTDLLDLESCVFDKTQEGASTFSTNESSTNGYAFIMSDNPILKNSLSFLAEEEDACVGYYKEEQGESSKTALLIGNSNKYPLNEFHCLYVVNGYLSITMNSKHDVNDMTPSKDETCINEAQLTKSCKYIHNLSKFITICYRNKKDSISSGRKKGSGNSAMYIFQKDGNCYFHKITFWQRIGFCQVIDGEILMSLFDWEMIQDQKWTVNPVAAVNIGGSVSIGAAFLFIAFAFVYYLGRSSKSTNYPA